MNKLTMVFYIGMLLLLSACGPKTTKKEKDDLPKGYTYTLTTSNFENFYDVDYKLDYNIRRLI